MIGKLLFFFLLMAAGAAQAAETKSADAIPSPVIAIVDAQRILQESIASKDMQKQLDSQRAKFQSVISAEESELRKAEQELAKLRTTAAPDVYAEKEQQLRQRFLSVERHVQARRKALDQAFTDSMDILRKSVVDIIEVVARERGANLVVAKQQVMWSNNKQQVLWSDKRMDITDSVLARLNKTMTQVPVKKIADEPLPADASPAEPKGGMPKMDGEKKRQTNSAEP